MPYALLAIETAVQSNELPPEWHTFASSKELHEGHTVLASGAHLWRLPQSLHVLSRLIVALDKYEYPYSIAFFNEEPIFQVNNKPDK